MLYYWHRTEKALIQVIALANMCGVEYAVCRRVGDTKKYTWLKEHRDLKFGSILMTVQEDQQCPVCDQRITSHQKESG